MVNWRGGKLVQWQGSVVMGWCSGGNEMVWLVHVLAGWFCDELVWLWTGVVVADADVNRTCVAMACLVVNCCGGGLGLVRLRIDTLVNRHVNELVCRWSSVLMSWCGAGLVWWYCG